MNQIAPAAAAREASYDEEQPRLVAVRQAMGGSGRGGHSIQPPHERQLDQVVAERPRGVEGG